FVLMATGQSALVAAGALRMPFLASLPFVGIIAAMGYELSRDVFKAAKLSEDLKNSQLRLSQAAAAASMVIWEWDVATGRILVSDKGRGIYGLPESTDVDLSLFLSILHEHDRPGVRRALDESLAGGAAFAEEYRVRMPDGSIRWISATGHVERDAHGAPQLMRGVSIDATERKSAEMRVELQRQELAHLSRVSVLGEMAGTLAHELNQPLAAILSNSQVGRRSMDQAQPDLAEMAAILDDISIDAKRAGHIIHGMRSMLKKSPPDDEAVIDVNETFEQVMALLQSEIIRRKKEIHPTLGKDLPKARAGQIEVQQILINMIINGLDAMQSQPAGLPMRIETFHNEAWVVIAIKDAGPGISPEVQPRLFEPFYTTKPEGLGLGLSISRSIAERLGGELSARNHPDGGAEFRLLLPIAT
ncbi:MAG: ATP-binding protein, partial [Akkermansiaceae bacterium]|nr:ATP-binding protein [Akkermansiaceae bacterium]